MADSVAVPSSNGIASAEKDQAQHSDADQSNKDASDYDHRIAEMERRLMELLERNELLGKKLEEIRKMLAARREAKYGEITGG